MMKFALISMLLIISGPVLSSYLSCYNLELNAGKSPYCFIQENAVLDRELVGQVTPQCTPKDISNGITTFIPNGIFCFMGVYRGTSSATIFNEGTNTSTTVTHSVVLVERRAGTSGEVAKNCTEQCKSIAAMKDIGNAAPMNRTLLHFACGNGENTNGQDATAYKTRTEQFNCDNLILTQTPTAGKTLAVWIIIVTVVVVVLLILLIIFALVMVCMRGKKAPPPGARASAAYRAQQTADESSAAVNS